jgi:hypothetical protein
MKQTSAVERVWHCGARGVNGTYKRHEDRRYRPSIAHWQFGEVRPSRLKAIPPFDSSGHKGSPPSLLRRGRLARLGSLVSQLNFFGGEQAAGNYFLCNAGLAHRLISREERQS